MTAKAKLEIRRRDFHRFVEKTFPDFSDGWVYRDLCERLRQFMLDIRAGKSPRLIVCLPPRMGKSQITSIRFALWCLLNNPRWEIIVASYGQSLSNRFSRFTRSLMESHPYIETLWPDIRLASGHEAVEEWKLERKGAPGYLGGGTYRAVGRGSAITGSGAHCLLCDDTLKDFEEAESLTVRGNLWDWYSSTARTRLSPGGGVVIVQCMVGDTEVSLANGENKYLRDINIGDVIATYDSGKITASKVVNWTSQGVDSVFRIKTKGGIEVKANKRHPFLVDRGEGKLEWVRVENLRAGDALIRADGESGEGLSVVTKTVMSPCIVRESAPTTMKKSAGKTESIHQKSTEHPAGKHISNAVMASQPHSSTRSSQTKGACALSAANPPQQTCEPTGEKSFALTTVMTRGEFGDCCATTATWPSGTERPQKFSTGQRDTYWRTSLDKIESITPCGEEEVFDIQVEGTENFLANGLVSHNTRWHPDDLVGRLLQEEKNNPEADKWQLVEYRALAEEDEPHRKAGESILPERWSAAELKKTKANMVPRWWDALYQQRPVARGGNLFKEAAFRRYLAAPRLDEFDQIIQVWDLRFGKSQKNTSSFVVGWIIGRKDAQFYVLDEARDRWSYAESRDQLRWMTERWPHAIAKIIENKANGPAIESDLETEIPGIVLFDPKGDKYQRAERVLPLCLAGNVYLPADEVAPWAKEALQEICAFPRGADDDRVDVLSMGLGWFMERDAQRCEVIAL